MVDPQLSALLVQFGLAPEDVEAMLSAAVYFTIVAVVAAIPTSVVARRKGRSVLGWVVLALSFPLLPLLVVWLLPARKPE